MIKITLHTLPVSGSKYTRCHFRLKKAYREAYAWELLAALPECWRALPKDQIPAVKARITVYWGKGQRMFDDDNLAAGLKPLIDGMRDIHLIRNDSPRWFRLEANQERDPERPRMEIEIDTLQSLKETAREADCKRNSSPHGVRNTSTGGMG